MVPSITATTFLFEDTGVVAKRRKISIVWKATTRLLIGASLLACRSVNDFRALLETVNEWDLEVVGGYRFSGPTAADTIDRSEI
jgi:hypothetical protein